MRFSRPPTLLSLLFTVLSSHHTIAAPQNPREKELLETRYHYLAKRECAGTLCGWIQICCTGGQTCSTNYLGQAECVGGTVNGPLQNAAANGDGQWQFYTTTSIETDLTTVTLTYSSLIGSEATTTAAGASVSGISCDGSLGEKPCGTLCCASGQTCAYSGYCAASGNQGDVSSSYLASVMSTTEGTNTATAFIRPTSSVTTTTTATGSMTTTVPFESASAAPTAAAGMAATSSNNGLSGGAIAGIVIGVIAAIIILLLICACLCFGAALDRLLHIFGLGRKKRREETYIEERHSHHASGGGGGRTWFGTRPARVDRPKKKNSGVGGFTGVAAALATLAIVLGLKRRNKKKESAYSGSDYTYSDTYSSESSASSDRRTRDTRRSSGRR